MKSTAHYVLPLFFCSCSLRANVGNLQSEEKQVLAWGVYGGKGLIESGLRGRFGNSKQEIGATISVGYRGSLSQLRVLNVDSNLDSLHLIGHVGCTPLQIAKRQGESKLALFSPWTELGLGWRVAIKERHFVPYLSFDSEYNNWGNDDPNEVSWGIRFGLMLED